MNPLSAVYLDHGISVRKISTRLKAFCILGSLLASLAYAQSPGEPVTPKQLFPGEILNIYAPDSEGWLIAAVESHGIAFGKRGARKNDTYGAQVVLFELPEMTSGEELVSFVQERIAMLNPAPRFQETRSSYQYNEDRGYPCVNVHIDFDDTAAVVTSGRTQRLKLSVVSLYCRHPQEQGLGFFAAYSHRGKKPDKDIETAAKSFIEAIEVPEP
jgi:hypothetical protein